MSKKKPIDKAQARERRDRMLDAAAAARLSLTEGVREMRAIAGMTQEEFAQHRGVSARVIKAIELAQGNPTVATLNRIGAFFGLEVGFVPVRRPMPASEQPQPSTTVASAPPFALTMTHEAYELTMRALYEHINDNNRMLAEALARLDDSAGNVSPRHKKVKRTSGSPSKDTGAANTSLSKKKKPPLP